MKSKWKTVTLEGVCRQITDGSHFSPKTADSGFPYITVRDIENDQIDFDNCKFVSAFDFNQLLKNGCKPNKGDVLFSKDGTVGKVALVDYERDFVVLSSLAILRPDNNQIDSTFLKYVLKSPAILDEAIGKKTGVAIRRIILRNLKAILVPVPPLSEQQRIVGILDEAFDGIATAKINAEQNLQNARALFESHLHGVTTEKALLGDLVNITTGKLDANAAVEGGKFPFFTCSREIYAIDDYAFDCEAILLAGNNAVGDFNVKHYKGKFNAYQRTYIITVNEQKRVLYRFLYFQMLKSLKKFKAQSVGVGTKFLKLGMIKEMEIELPSLAEQERIVSTMDSLREETQRLESLYQRKLAALDELKKSLLHQAFSGAL